MARRTFLCRLIFCAVFSASIVNIFTHSSSPSFFLRYSKPAALHHHEQVSCSQAEVADDVLIVLRTGATESREKLPVHFQTTLRCVPHFVVFSDLDEEIDGHAVHDVLGGVSDDMKKEHDDFKLYRHLKEHGRQGLRDQQVMMTESGSSKGDYLNTENDGWKLDKWKFLPMVDQAYQHMPNAKWFVFIESDTFLSWHNLMEYLSNFDANKPYYIGKHLYINDIEFGYGGAGFILSNPAVRKVTEHRSVRVRDYEDFTATHWVGDCALGKVLEDIKIPLHRAFPHLQGDSPATLDPATNKIDRDAWCYPAVTYHHVSPSEISALWKFEQSWVKKHDGALLRHRDIFMEHVRPQIKSRLGEWDNMSADKEYTPASYNADHRLNEIERNAWKSYDKCRELCESKSSCLQFSYREKRCGISHTFRWGYKSEDGSVSSGWMLDRVDGLFAELEQKCGFRDWFSPHEGSTVQRRR
ncbi:hypothetical protein BDV96DRAFT_649418 [Lophiotrema nucula]|uniref:N-acetylgalactosaminide beta-1,3-galactosyltransferase n=1 Tax=Lophiotrema nucula TaxID=690887 RepID=A0A6A5YYT7_9PLEO|nr:hypothetical protein BDV96DRAFT_649418 [Lophiotrema nucula]